MKKPENFSASATVKKPNPLEEAINSNFSTNTAPTAPVQTVQAPVATVSVQTPVPPVVTSTITQAAAPVQTVPAPKPARKDEREKFLVAMSKGERAIFKSFCALQNISMNHFVMCAMDYFKEDLEKGKVTISPHSYKRTED